MRLLAGDNPAAVARYRHIKRARGWGKKRCRAKCPATPHRCTRERGHRAPHVAHGLFGRIAAVWDAGSGSGSQRASQAASDRESRGGRVGPKRGRTAKGRPIGLTEDGPTGWLHTVWRGIVHTFTSIEELSFIILFVLFVYFGTQWIVMILQ